MIHFEELTYRYPSAEEPILRDLAFDIEEGEFLLAVSYTHLRAHET